MECLATGTTVGTDLTEFAGVDTEGKERVSFSANMIGWALAYDVGQRAENYRWMGPSRYMFASVLEVIKAGARAGVTLRINGGAEEFVLTEENPLNFLALMHTRHTGAGMEIFPQADMGDGYFGSRSNGKAAVPY